MEESIAGNRDGGLNHHDGPDAFASGLLCPKALQIQAGRRAVSGLCPFGLSYEVCFASVSKANGCPG